MRFLKVVFDFLTGMCDGCKKRSDEILVNSLKSDGSSFFTSHSRARNPTARNPSRWVFPKGTPLAGHFSPVKSVRKLYWFRPFFGHHHNSKPKNCFFTMMNVTCLYKSVITNNEWNSFFESSGWRKISLKPAASGVKSG